MSGHDRSFSLSAQEDEPVAIFTGYMRPNLSLMDMDCGVHWFKIVL
jgi:hypothetical protein